MPPTPPDTPDQVREKFFTGTACPGNDPADVMVPGGEPISPARTGHNAIEEGPDGLYTTCDGLLGQDADAIVAEMAAYPEPGANPHNDGPDVMLAVRRALERAGYRLPS